MVRVLFKGRGNDGRGDDDSCELWTPTAESEENQPEAPSPGVRRREEEEPFDAFGSPICSAICSDTMPT